MDTVQRNQLNQLFINLLDIIRSAPADGHRVDAFFVLEFYLYNPFEQRERGFFKTPFEYLPFHSIAADKEYVPMLTHILNTAYTVLTAEITQLEMTTGLGLCAERIVSKETLRQRFVRGLSALATVDHKDYNAIRGMIINQLFKEEINDQPGTDPA